MADTAPKALDKEQFSKLTQTMLEEDYGELTLEQFCTAMDAVEEESPRISLCIFVKVDQDQIIAYGPDGRPLPNNTLRLGGATIEIRPRPEG